jgi:hypothetical protein
MKNSTRILILIVITQMTTASAFMLMHLTSMWLEIGHGLHPWLGIPAACLLALSPYIFHSLLFEPDSTDNNPSTINLRGYPGSLRDTEGNPKPRREWLNHSTENSNDH